MQTDLPPPEEMEQPNTGYASSCFRVPYRLLHQYKQLEFHSPKELVSFPDSPQDFSDGSSRLRTDENPQPCQKSLFDRLKACCCQPNRSWLIQQTMVGSGYGLLAIGLGAFVFGTYVIFRWNWERRHLAFEDAEARIAVMPLLMAENDR
ncbi:hypothetical protein L345_15200, partial [Ophiophagus hannah]